MHLMRKKFVTIVEAGIWNGVLKVRRGNTAAGSSSSAVYKRAALLALLVLACVAMSACYMEPDRVVDNNGLDNNGQNFETIITNTPVPTNTPEPTPTPTENNQQLDWSQWDFGNDTATNPPSNVITVAPSSPTTAPGIQQPTIQQTQPPQQGGSSSISVNPKNTPTPTKAPASTSLRKGSKGAEVKKLQQRLKDLKYYNGSVDGSYGDGTVSAVKGFQGRNGLTADGIAGAATLRILYSSNAVPNKTASSGSSGNSGGGSKPNPTKAPANSYTNGRTDIYLDMGDTGSQVKTLQNRLIVLGYLSGTADGVFAETTEAAVMAFQKRNSIYADGVAGPTTLTKLYSSSAKKASGVVANLGSLKAGMNGSSVRALQTQLKKLGYYTGSVDGDYGEGTSAAVIAFQRDNGLTVDGIAGKSTLNAIYGATGSGSGGGGSSSGSSGSKTNPSRYGVSASSNGYKTISSNSGSSSSNVKALQSALSSTGYYSGSSDGEYGSGTEAAVKAFQKARGLRVTGMAGPSTQRLLYGGTSESGSYSKLDIGSSGSAVKRLQYALYELKYYDGDITGKYDETTKNAVYLFQQVNGLYVDGIAGQDTQRKLFSSNAKPCDI